VSFKIELMEVLLLNLSLGLRILSSSLKPESFSASNSFQPQTWGRGSSFGRLAPATRFSTLELLESSFVVFL
jgi:hypothetical protein